MEFRFVIKNVGVGPAFIESRQFFLDGSLFNCAPEEAVDELAKRLLEGKCRYHIKQKGMIGSNSIIPAGEEISLVHIIYFGVTPENREELLAETVRVRFDVSYRSLYGDKFEFTSG